MSDYLDEATAKFTAISNALIGMKRFDCGSAFQEPPYEKAVQHIGKRTAGTPRTLTQTDSRLLRIAWQTELAALVTAEFDDDMLRRISAQTLPVQTYYAVFSAARAMTAASGAPCETHKAVHRDFETQRAKLCFGSWGVTLAGDPKAVETCVLEPPISVPVAFNLMEQGREDEDYVWAALRMTRRWKVAQARDAWLKANRKRDGSPRKRLPADERSQLTARLPPTTVMDLLYELRRRTNYEGVEEYSSDATDLAVHNFHAGLLHLTNFALLHYEALLANRIGVSAYAHELDAWAASANKVGSWATKRPMRRLQAIESVARRT